MASTWSGSKTIVWIPASRWTRWKGNDKTRSGSLHENILFDSTTDTRSRSAGSHDFDTVRMRYLMPILVDALFGLVSSIVTWTHTHNTFGMIRQEQSVPENENPLSNTLIYYDVIIETQLILRKRSTILKCAEQSSKVEVSTKLPHGSSITHKSYFFFNWICDPFTDELFGSKEKKYERLMNRINTDLY